MIGGQAASLEVTSLGKEPAGATPPAQRNDDQIKELQETADDIVKALDKAAGGDSGLEVVNTRVGAEIDGIFDDVRVPIENVIVAQTTGFTGLYASLDANDKPTPVQGGVLEMVRGGEVAVIVHGLKPGAEAELVLMSTPLLLGTATADASGGFTRLLGPPDSVADGEHTLVTATDSIVVSLGIRIVDRPTKSTRAKAALPATGSELPVAPSLVLIALGSVFVLACRRRATIGR